jgi:hypothetical protein
VLVALVDRDRLPGQPRPGRGLEVDQLGVAAVAERGGPGGAGRGAGDLGGGVAENVLDRLGTGRGRGDLGAAGRRRDGLERRAVHLDEAAVLGHVRLQAVAEDRHAADRLDEAEVVGALDVDVVLAQRQGGQFGGVQAEDVGMGGHVVEGDGGRLLAARRGQEAVELRDPPRRTGGLVDVDDALHPELLAQGAHGRAGRFGHGRSA